MLNLPLRAFRIEGNSDYIDLSIDEVIGFPEETSYGDGYGARGMLDIQVGNYTAHASHYFTTGELYDFHNSLAICYEQLSGKAVLNSVESELKLAVYFEKLGHISVCGDFQERQDIDTHLTFEMHSDQTQIKSILLDLKKVIAVFGDKQGLNRNQF